MYASERIVADVLDSLDVRWEYEPTLFVLELNERGHCIDGFQPDFYLPEHDLYIEVTQAKIKTRKNGKLRRFRAAYPGVTVHLLDAHAFDDLAAWLKRVLDIEAKPC